MFRGRRALVAVAALTSFVVLLLPAGASAAPGDLTFVRCASQDGSAGACSNLPGSAFDEPRAVTVTGGGQPIVAARTTTFSVSRLTADLGFVSCAANIASGGTCSDLVSPALYRPPTDVVVTPDGGALYVSGSSDDAVTRYALQPDGGLVYQGCVSNNGSGGACVDLPGAAFDAPAAMAISPSGSTLYVASRVSNSVSRFGIGAGGALTYGGCVSDNGSGGTCDDVPGSDFNTPEELAVSPDGTALYTSASLSDTVTRFTIAPSGQPVFASCVSNLATAGCTDLPGSALLEPRALALAPDGSTLYVAAISSDSVVDLSISAAGTMSFAGCSSQSGSAGTCADLPDVFADPWALAASPDGRSLYVSAATSDSLSRFDLGDGGSATFSGCFSDTGSAGACADLPGAAFDRPTGLAMNAAGSMLYATASDSDSITQFAREVPDTTPPGLTVNVKKKGKAGRPIAVTLTCDEACSVALSGTAKPKGGKRGKLVGNGGELATGEPTKLKLKPKGKLKRKLRQAGKGKASIAIVATDASGNEAEASAKVKLK